MKIATFGSLTADAFFLPRRTEETDERISFALGDKIKVEEEYHTFGGGATNVAVGLQRQGIPASVFGAVGDDRRAEYILENLKKAHVHTNTVQIKKKAASGFSYILSAKSGERVVFYDAGANEQFCEISRQDLEDFDGFCLQHLSCKDGNVFETLSEHCLQYPEKFLSWNPGREALEKGAKHFQELLSVVDVLLLNKEEGQLFTGRTEISDIMNTFFDQGMQGVCLVTDGRKGSYGSTGRGIHFQETLNHRERRDTLGAGDSYLSGFVGAYLRGKDLATSMLSGTINAASVVSFFGAQKGLLSSQEMQGECKALVNKRSSRRVTSFGTQ